MCSSVDRARGYGLRCQGFDSLHTRLILVNKLRKKYLQLILYARVAQSVEQRTENPCVTSSSLVPGILVKEQYIVS